MKIKIAPLMFLGACASLPQSGSLGEDIDALVQRQLKGGSLIAAVVEDGEIMRIAGYGSTNPNGEDPPGRDTPYRIASISKLFTGVLAMQLAERGELDLDAPITDVLPDLRVATDLERPITMRHLLTHTSGLPSDRVTGMFSAQPETMEQLLAALADDELTHEPGAWQAYSNVGFTVAGYAAQEAGGLPFADLVAERIFEPCGMESATWEFSPALTPTIRGESSWEGEGMSVVPAGGAVMSVDDLAAFATGLMNHGRCEGAAILRPETLSEMEEVQEIGALSGDSSQGLAFQIESDAADAGGRTVIWHDGATLHYASMLRVVPELDLAVIVFTNEATAQSLVHEVARELLREAVAEKTGETPPEAPEAAPANGELDEADLDALAGLYATAFGPLTIERHGQVLDAKGTGNHFRFVPTSQGTFRIRPTRAGVLLPTLVDGLELRFVTIDGHDLVQTVRDDRASTIGERIEGRIQDEGWSAHIGVWMPVRDRPEDALAITEARVVDHADHLELEVDLHRPTGDATSVFVILPMDEHRARIAGIGRSMGEVVRVESGILHVMGAELQR
jgi:CubicO group peptidase (beta-lactamase class C family)